jgi:hypothetical protein
MSLNRLIYDSCEYKKSLKESVSPLAYQIFPEAHEHSAKCRIEFGQNSGTTGVSTPMGTNSIYNGNLIDIENDLKNITRPYSRCPNKKFQYNNSYQCKKCIMGLPCNSNKCNNKVFVHEKPCNIVRYKPTPLPEPIKVNFCSYK